MKGIEFFFTVITILFVILQIMLFFKIWQMTDDVRKLTHKFCEKKKEIVIHGVLMDDDEETSGKQTNNTGKGKDGTGASANYAKGSRSSSLQIPPAPTTEVDSYDKRLDKVECNDKVRRIYDGKIMKVDAVSPSHIFCKGGFVEGYKWYPKSALEYIEKS